MRWKKLLCDLTGLEEEQIWPAALAALYIFCILGGYYILKPLREDIGLLVGKEYTTRLFMGTMLAMLVANPIFSSLVNKFSRASFIKLTYRFFALNILGFIAIFKYLESLGQMPEGGQAVNVTGLAFSVGVVFFIWVSVFNLFCGSIFWALMADLYKPSESKKLFGLVGAGGTFGGFMGSLATMYLVDVIGPTNLLFVTVFLLEVAVWAMVALTKGHVDPPKEKGELKPKAFSGISDILKSKYLLGICLYFLLYAFTSSFLYFQQQYIVDASISDREARVDYYATISMIVNGLTLVIQLFFTGRLVTFFGLAAGLSLVPVITILGFAALGFQPGLLPFAIVDIVRKTANYGITRPSREILYTVVSRREKYLSKSFIDTFVYRGGDAIASGSFELIKLATTNLQMISLLAVPFGIAYFLVGLVLGKSYNKKVDQSETATSSTEVGAVGVPLKTSGD